MNEITKEKIAEKVIFAITAEKLMNVEAAKHLGLTSPAYLSMIKKHEQFDKCPESAWKKMREWVYSGKSLVEYKPGFVEEKEPKPEAQPPLPGIIIKVRPTAIEQMKERIAKRTAGTDDVKVIKVTKTFIGADEINKKLTEIRKEAKKNRKESAEKVQVPEPTEEEMEKIISSIGLEIDIVIKLKHK
jgi:hypothetical protein